jgi:hypothetical protein
MYVSDILGAVFHGIDAIEGIAKNKLGLSPDDALKVIVKMVQTIRSGADGDVAPARVIAELDQLKTKLGANDAIVASEADAKYPK